MPSFLDLFRFGLSSICSGGLRSTLLPFLALINVTNIPLMVICQTIFWIIIYMPVQWAVRKYRKSEISDLDRQYQWMPYDTQLSLFIAIVTYVVVFWLGASIFVNITGCPAVMDAIDIDNSSELTEVNAVPEIVNAKAFDTTWEA